MAFDLTEIDEDEDEEDEEHGQEGDKNVLEAKVIEASKVRVIFYHLGWKIRILMRSDIFYTVSHKIGLNDIYAMHIHTYICYACK